MLGLFAAVACAAGASGAASTTRTFDDTIGEDPAGPDITAVGVSSDGNVLTFRVFIPTTPSVTPDFRLRIWLDADDSLETGLAFDDGPTGLDHFLLVDPTRFRPDEALLYGCTGVTNVCAPVPAAVEFTYASGATFTLDARSLGLQKVERLRFSVTATTGIGYDPATGYDFTNAHFDLAPDAAEDAVQPMWTFTARPLRVTTLRSTPPQPRAGRSLTLTMRVVDNETGAPLSKGKVTCLLRVRGERVPPRAHGLSRGLATCRFDVPASSRGKRFQATVRVTARGTTVGRSLTGRIR